MDGVTPAPWNRVNRIALRMRVKLSNELTDGLFSPRKNNRINLLDKQLQGMPGRSMSVSKPGNSLEVSRKKTFNEKNIPLKKVTKAEQNLTNK